MAMAGIPPSQQLTLLIAAGEITEASPTLLLV
jgi:hypothetical protein